MSCVCSSWKMLKAKIQVCRSKDPLSPAPYCLLSSTECPKLISISWNMHLTCSMGCIWPHDGSLLTGKTFSGHDFLSEARLWSCRWAPQRQAASCFKSNSNFSIGEIIYPRRAQRFLQSQKLQQHDKSIFFLEVLVQRHVCKVHIGFVPAALGVDPRDLRNLTNTVFRYRRKMSRLQSSPLVFILAANSELESRT